MHGVINKACMEKFKTLIAANVSHNSCTKISTNVENDKVLNFFPTTNIKKIKDTQDIPKYSFQFFGTNMLSNRVQITTCTSR